MKEHQCTSVVPAMMCGQICRPPAGRSAAGWARARARPRQRRRAPGRRGVQGGGVLGGDTRRWGEGWWGWRARSAGMHRRQARASPPHLGQPEARVDGWRFSKAGELCVAVAQNLGGRCGRECRAEGWAARRRGLLAAWPLPARGPRGSLPGRAPPWAHLSLEVGASGQARLLRRPPRLQPLRVDPVLSLGRCAQLAACGLGVSGRGGRGGGRRASRRHGRRVVRQEDHVPGLAALPGRHGGRGRGRLVGGAPHAEAAGEHKRPAEAQLHVQPAAVRATPRDGHAVELRVELRQGGSGGGRRRQAQGWWAQGRRPQA